MLIPDDKALWLQEILLEYNGWQWGAANFAFGSIASVPADSEARWQFAVDMLYRTLTCGLTQLDVFVECYDRTSFLDAIRRFSPFGDEGALLWNGTQMSGTNRLSELAAGSFPVRGELDHTLNRAFIETVEKIFAENDVPWSEKPVLPIAPAADAAGTSVTSA